MHIKKKAVSEMPSDKMIIYMAPSQTLVSAINKDQNLLNFVAVTESLKSRNPKKKVGKMASLAKAKAYQVYFVLF